MTYPQAIRYLESFINYEKIPFWPYKKSLKLERFKGFLDIIGNPQDALKCLHIAGTKGKGSTCAFIAYILREAGYKVGLYTSPHLSDFRERIRILRPASSIQHPASSFEGMISQNGLADLTQRLRPAIEKYNKNSKYGPLSFFEVYTALGFIYFKENNADFVILETGLGGRLDATNVVNSYVCGITPISYEHTQKLGNTLREIATEKAGIIKAGCGESRYPIVISAPQENEAMQVIKEKCKKFGAELSVAGEVKNNPDLKVNLIGRHQLVNASVAIGIVEALKNYGVSIDTGLIRKGIANTLWPGRCEVFSRTPFVILDGAQNAASAKALKETIRENFSATGGSAKGGKYKKLILVLGISKDKDIKGVCKELHDLADKVILTKADNPRAAEPLTLNKYFSQKEHYLTGNVRQAKKLALRTAAKEDLILVCGSLFVVGEFRNDKVGS